jgi:hypothetical protein
MSREEAAEILERVREAAHQVRINQIVRSRFEFSVLCTLPVIMTLFTALVELEIDFYKYFLNIFVVPVWPL